MEITQYPGMIFNAAQDVNAVEAQILETRNQIARLENDVEGLVAFNAELKNDHQRKAFRWQVLSQKPEYVQLQAQLIALSKEKADKMGLLEMLRNELSLHKLKVRHQIAQAIAGDEAAELLGIRP